MTRIPCDVPGCRRTIGIERYRTLFHHEPGGWICPTHWALVPKAQKRVLARFKRRARRLGFNPAEDQQSRIEARIWRGICD